MVLLVAELDEYLDQREIHPESRAKRPREPGSDEIPVQREIMTRARQLWRDGQGGSSAEDGMNVSSESFSSQEQPPRPHFQESPRSPKTLCPADNAGLESPQQSKIPSVGGLVLGREKQRWQCRHCGVNRTPKIRNGPEGPKTLCNACGVRYRSGKLVPEYVPLAVRIEIRKIPALT